MHEPAIDSAVAILHTRSGKDKTIKLVQYTGRLVLRAADSPSLGPYAGPLAVRVAPLVRELSMFRKIIKLGDWIRDWRAVGRYPSVLDLVEVYTGLMDDLFLLAKIGVIDKHWAARFDRQASLAWMVCILANLSKRRRLDVDTAKLLCDFVFCSVDVLDLKVDSLVQTGAGLASGMLAYHKLWKKQRG